MLTRDCPNPRCRTGGLDRSLVKLGTRDLCEALSEARSASDRRVSQGHAPIATVYMCAAGYWHQSSKAPAHTAVATLDGFTIGRDANVKPATIAISVMVYRSTTKRTSVV